MGICENSFRWIRTELILCIGLFLSSVAFAQPRIEVTGGTPTFRDVALKFAPLQTQPVQPGTGINVWTSTGLTDQNILALAIDPVRPQIIYAGTEKGLFKSVNKGDSWTTIRNGE